MSVGKPIDVYDQRDAMSDWISVEDRYPPDLTTVLVYAKGMHQLDGVQMARFDQNLPVSMFWHGQIMGHKKGVTHWMPLPTPPDTEQKEGKA